MKIACPSCKKAFEMEHVERGRKVQCQCSCKFLLDDKSVLEDYSAIDEAPPKRIGPCEIERFIGRGGMGRVYKGRHPTLGIPVAVKTLLKEFASDRTFKVRFIQSAKICAQVDHPNIVRIYDCGEEDGCVYLILEYIGGGSVQRMIERHGPLSNEKIFDVAIAVCKGLAEAARHGIVHRDIKPENIMRSRDGEYKLSDLGLAKQRSEDQKKFDPSLTMAFVSLGTPQYMPPEQAIDAKSCDQRADIYSLGVSLYEIATGRLPFDSKDPVELRKLHGGVEPEPPSKLRPDIDPNLEKIILKCMRKDRDERYQSPEELLAEFLALKEGRRLPSEVAAEERIASARLEKARKRESLRKAAMLAVKALLALCLAAIVFLLYWPPSSPEAGAPPPPPSQAAKPHASKGSKPLNLQDDAPKSEAQSAAAALEKVDARRRELWSYASGLADKAMQAGDFFDTAIANLKAFTEDEDSKEIAPEANRRIEELSAAKSQAVAKVIDSLREKAASMISAGDFLKAASLYETYAGRMSKDTAAQRQTLAASLRESARKIEDARKSESESFEAKRKALLAEISEKLLERNLDGAISLASSPEAVSAVPGLSGTLLQVKAAPSTIVDSFRSQIGMRLLILIGGSKAIVTIKKVEDGEVFADETLDKANLLRRFGASDLTLQERLGRLPGLPQAARSIYAGLDELSSGSMKDALAYFRRSGVLASAISQRLESAIKEKAEAEASAELLAILSSCSFKVKALPGSDEFPDLVAWMHLSPEAAAKTSARLREFLLKYLETDVGREYSQAVGDVVQRLEDKASSALPPAKKQSALPVRKPAYKIKTADDLNKELVIFNSDYLGDAYIAVVEGRGFTLDISDKPVSNLEPLKGLTVRTLIANGSLISDLRPLIGSPIENLQFANSKVVDLKPLESMQLKCVAFSPDAIADKDDLLIIRRMKSVESIGVPSAGSIKFVSAKEFWEGFDLREWKR